MIDRTDPDEDIYCTLAPPDLWNRSQETGKSKALLFSEAGLSLVKSNNDREAGWLSIKELLKVNDAGEARLHIFSTCRRLIKDLPALMRDDKRPTDVSNEPHDITHAPDSLRYFAIYWTRPAAEQVNETRVKYPPDLLADYRKAPADVKARIEKRMGGKPLW
jgi:phage terminase large subunit